VLKLRDGWWYDATPKELHLSAGVPIALRGDTAVFACLNPKACSVFNETLIKCAEHAAGPLCAVCEEGFVPDAAAVDGRCKECESSIVERWVGKSALLSICALIFFIIGFFVISRPAPKLKIDWLLTQLNVRRIFRRYRKRVLHRLVERDHSIADNGVDDEARAQCAKLLNENKLVVAAHVHHTLLATHSAGLAATSVGASTGAGAAATKVKDVVRHTVEQALHTGEDHVADEIETMLVDTDGSLRSDGVRRNSLDFDAVGNGARAIIGDGSSPKSCFTDFVAQVRRTGATLASLLMTPGQLKILLGSLQINASLTVVFDIPWPPVHIRFINFLSVFKLDLFKGLSFMAPCLHSSHFMSLASFVVAVRTLLCISNVLIIYRHADLTFVTPPSCSRSSFSAFSLSTSSPSPLRALCSRGSLATHDALCTSFRAAVSISRPSLPPRR
jgi:hypothetical protein